MDQAEPLKQSVQYLKGVGRARAELLRRLGIETIADLLFHFPRSYEDLTDVRPISQLSADRLQTVHGEVVEIAGRHLADGRCIVSVVLGEGRHCLEGVWFNQPHAARSFRYGQRLAFSGKPKWYRDHWQMASPRVQVLDGPVEAGASAVVPIYPLTENLRADQLRAMIRQAVSLYGDQVPEMLPVDLRKRHGFPDAPQALRQVHAPETLAAARAGRCRFVYEEFLMLQLALALRRRELRDRQHAPSLPLTPAIDARIRRLFPFRFTADQDRAASAISRDLASERPMQRLLQGDVGAGKTAVAVYALLVAVANRHQAILMAPTEVLARQHWQTIETCLARSRVRRLLLTGALSPRERRKALAAIRQGEIDLVVGTQTLIQESVQFARLGLVIIDEQHRFGVNQRAQVRRLGIDPHYLVMTATPIPRTVALTVFGDLDVSTIRQLPPDRQPVLTRWVPANRRGWVYDRVREGLRQGRQAYIVCPLVAAPDPEKGTVPLSSKGQSPFPYLKAAEQTYTELRDGPLRDFRLGLLHGQLDEEAKEQVMQQFRARKLDVLVTTTIVEVGVDVPNATLLVVEHAERFGLSQLHQLRGRVSRGAVAGQCYLFAEPGNDEAKERLRLLTRISDGFALAEHDARLRGLGEFFGTRQHGLGEFRLGDLITDHDILKLARQDAFSLVAADAGLRRPEHALLRRAVLEKYGQTLELAEVG
jgi:ATP-dependent DNA helicase RecG